MSWDYHVAGDAWASIRQLDGEAQEQVLDAIEEFAHEAAMYELDGEQTELLVVFSDGRLVSIGLRFLANPMTQLVTLLGFDE